MAIVLSLTAAQQKALTHLLNHSNHSTELMEIHAKLIRPIKAKQSAALLDAIVDSSISPTPAEPGSDANGSASGATILADGTISAPEPEWDDNSGRPATSGTGSQVLQPATAGVDLELDSNSHPDGFSDNENFNLSSN